MLDRYQGGRILAKYAVNSETTMNIDKMSPFLRYRLVNICHMSKSAAFMQVLQKLFYLITPLTEAFPRRTFIVIVSGKRDREIRDKHDHEP
jgi:hypothetical protein